MLLQCVYSLKARSHGAIFFFATAMQKMECVDVNGVFIWCDFLCGVCDITHD